MFDIWNDITIHFMPRTSETADFLLSRDHLWFWSFQVLKGTTEHVFEMKFNRDAVFSSG